MFDVVVSQLVIVKAEVASWILHKHMSICWGFFAINNGFGEIVSVVIIICKSKQTFGDALMQDLLFERV
jgi:hypothetical protein